MENIWNILCRKAYANNIKFSSISKLKITIVKEWHNICEFEFNHLVTSVKNRVFEIVRKKWKANIALIYILFLYLDKWFL